MKKKKKRQLENPAAVSLSSRLKLNKHTYLTAKMWLRSSMTLLSLFCSSLRKSLASTLSWKSMNNINTSVIIITTLTTCMETYIFASHGLKHLLQLNSELLDVIDDDTWLREEREKSLHTHIHKHFSLPFLHLLPNFLL